MGISYRNEILWLFKDRKLFEKSIKLVTLWLGLHTSNTRLAELLYISTENGPERFIAN